MSTLIPAPASDLQHYDPAKGLKSVAVAEALVQHLRRAKDLTHLLEAVELKLREPRAVVTWWDGQEKQARAGRLVVTEGTVCDYDRVEAEIIELSRASGVRELAYDKRFASQMALHLQGAGLTVIDTPQGFGLNEALGRLSDLVKAGKLLHGGHPILAWMAGKAVIRHGMRGEIRLDKEKSGDKVDGIAALAMALSRAMAHMTTSSIYETRGVLAL